MDRNDSPLLKQSAVVGQTSQGYEIRSVPVHLDRHRVVFEVSDPQGALRLSEVLSDFKLICRDQTLYSGRAVITNLLNAGLGVLCEASLEDAWFDSSLAGPVVETSQFGASFSQFLGEWQKLYAVLPEYKIVIADLQSFLMDLRLWLEQIEVGIRSSPSARRHELEEEAMEKLAPSTSPAIAALFERYEAVARKLEAHQVPAHQAFGRRYLHPLLLVSPFVYRTFRKPLGYAGDYEMVSMMMRSPYEGSSLFAKTINAYALALPPIVAHRNRLAYLRQKLGEEARRTHLAGRPARLLSVGCGPACELQLFLAEDDCSDRVEATLLDFNQETLDYAAGALGKCRETHHRSTVIRTVKQSVQQILRQAARPGQGRGVDQFDFIYCAGLFDYLPDALCKSLISHYYRLLAPGGLLVATNVDDHPSRNEMECFLEWHLIYRDSRQMATLAPEGAAPENVHLLCEPAGVNLFLEARKPACEPRQPSHRSGSA
jgi:extracellular factor (EF) 3-hydroxypalmitic acid methyl ester biosynthesis protein